MPWTRAAGLRLRDLRLALRPRQQLRRQPGPAVQAGRALARLPLRRSLLPLVEPRREEPPGDGAAAKTNSRRSDAAHWTASRVVASLDADCAYTCAYRFVSKGRSSLQFAAPLSRALC